MMQLTAEQRKARIEFTKQRIEALRFSIKQHAFESIRKPLQSELAVAEIALAALTAEPVAYWHHSGQVVTREESHDDKVFDICCKVERPLYTAPPVAAPAVPDGWKLVPVEPNWEMLSADGCKEHHNGQPCLHHDNRRRIWSAMLAAAPSPSDSV